MKSIYLYNLNDIEASSHYHLKQRGQCKNLSLGEIDISSNFEFDQVAFQEVPQSTVIMYFKYSYSLKKLHIISSKIIIIHSRNMIEIKNRKSSFGIFMGTYTIFPNTRSFPCKFS